MHIILTHTIYVHKYTHSTYIHMYIYIHTVIHIDIYT